MRQVLFKMSGAYDKYVISSLSETMRTGCKMWSGNVAVTCSAISFFHLEQIFLGYFDPVLFFLVFSLKEMYVWGHMNNKPAVKTITRLVDRMYHTDVMFIYQFMN